MNTLYVSYFGVIILLTRLNWPRQVRAMNWAVCKRVGLQGPRGSRGRPRGLKGAKGWACIARYCIAERFKYGEVGYRE